MGGRGGGDIERQRPRQGARDRRMDEPSEESAGGRRGRGRGRRRRGARPAPDASASAGRPARAPSRDSGPEYEYYEHDSVMPVHGRGHVRGEADDGVEFPQPLAADTAGAPVPHRSHAASIGGNGPDELADAEIGANARLQGGREALAGAPLSTAPAGAVGDGDFAAMWSNMLGHRGGGAPVSGAAPARPSTASRVLREAPQSPPAAAAPEPPEASPLAQSPRAAGPSSGQGSPRTARRAGGGKGPDLRQALRRERAARAEAERVRGSSPPFPSKRCTLTPPRGTSAPTPWAGTWRRRARRWSGSCRRTKTAFGCGRAWSGWRPPPRRSTARRCRR